MAETEQSFIDSYKTELNKWNSKYVNGEYFVIKHKFRAKNEMGGLILNEKTFILDNNYKVLDSYN